MRLEGERTLKRVCICGNSHIAALKFALRDGVYDNPRIDFQFWGLPAKKFRTIDYRDGALVTSEAALMREVTGLDAPRLELDRFDAVVFHGCEITLTDWLASIKAAFNDLSDPPAAFLRDGLQSCFEPLHVSRLIRRVRENHDMPVFASPNPFVSMASAKFKKLRVSAAEIGRFQSAIALAVEDLGATYLPQPEDTIKRRCFTHPKFSRDAPILRDGIDRQRPKNEHHHMNQHYGARVLAKIARLLDGAVVGSHLRG